MTHSNFPRPFFFWRKLLFCSHLSSFFVSGTNAPKISKILYKTDSLNHVAELAVVRIARVTPVSKDLNSKFSPVSLA